MGRLRSPIPQTDRWSTTDGRCVQEVCAAHRTSNSPLKRQHRVLGHVSWEAPGYTVLMDVWLELNTMLLMTGAYQGLEKVLNQLS